MKKNIYISFALEDHKLAEKLINELKKKYSDYKNITWIIPSKLNLIEPHTYNFEKQLKEASIILLLITKNSTFSTWQLFELGAAKAQGKQIIPISIQGGVENIPSDLLQTKVINGRNLSLTKLADIIIKELNKN